MRAIPCPAGAPLVVSRDTTEAGADPMGAGSRRITHWNPREGPHLRTRRFLVSRRSPTGRLPRYHNRLARMDPMGARGACFGTLQHSIRVIATHRARFVPGGTGLYWDHHACMKNHNSKLAVYSFCNVIPFVMCSQQKT